MMGYRKRAYNLKMKLELVEREISEKKVGKPKQARRTFVNGCGEATIFSVDVESLSPSCLLESPSFCDRMMDIHPG